MTKQRVEMIYPLNPPQCEATRTNPYANDTDKTDFTCKRYAKYKIDDKCYCSAHAQSLALAILMNKDTDHPSINTKKLSRDIVRKWCEEEKLTVRELLSIVQRDRNYPDYLGALYRRKTGFKMSRTGELRVMGFLRAMVAEEAKCSR